MNFPWAVEILGLIFLIWLSTITFLFRRERNFLRELFPKSGSRDIRNKIKELVQIIEDYGRRNEFLEKQLNKLQKEDLYHIQKVEVLRYNPYNDTGGDQSFTVGLLDGNWNGVLITSLHSRAGTRVYVKRIENSKSEVELSKEEDEVLKRAVS